jgi:catalase
VADAFAHCKYIAFTGSATALMAKAGVAPDVDEGLISSEGRASVSLFIQSCRRLRLWAREAGVKL